MTPDGFCVERQRTLPICATYSCLVQLVFLATRIHKKDDNLVHNGCVFLFNLWLQVNVVVIVIIIIIIIIITFATHCNYSAQHEVCITAQPHTESIDSARTCSYSRVYVEVLRLMQFPNRK